MTDIDRTHPTNGEALSGGNLRPVSVVINTLNRGHILERSLLSLRYQTYPNFEVIVVNGPSNDDTAAILARWGELIKPVAISEANLSKSRNAGIAESAGELIVFLDDDAFAEPDWIANVAAGYDSPSVGGVGTRVWDHHGFQEQQNPRLIDQYYSPIFGVELPVTAFTFRDSLTIPHILGASSSFRRDLLVEIGGFDEEIEYFLDESEVCRRIAELGFGIKFVDRGASVHHKYAAGVVRNDRKVLSHPYPVIKNKYYTVLRDARSRSSSLSVALRKCELFAEELIGGARRSLVAREISTEVFRRFQEDVTRGAADGQRRGLLNGRRSRVFATEPLSAFKPFEVLVPKRAKRGFVFISRYLPTEAPGGVAQFLFDLATGFAARGHDVTMITHSDDAPMVDYRDGVWIRRVAESLLDPAVHTQAGNLASGAAKRNWLWSALAHREVLRVRADRPVDLVVCPIWDTEGLHCLADARLNTVLTLQTTFRTFAALEGPALDADTVEELLFMEQMTLESARNVHAISAAILKGVRAECHPRADSRWEVAHLGVKNASVARLPESGSGREKGRLRILYVSRLETRKGTDIFLRAALQLAEQRADVEFHLIGRDTSGDSERSTYRSLAASRGPDLAERFIFEGQVSDATLRRRYAEADIFCVPSRYESFGLIYLEAMRAGLPVVACDVGGIPELIEDGLTGMLVPPDNVQALTAALARLASDPALRQRLGDAGHSRFLDTFTKDHMIDRAEELYCSFIDQGQDVATSGIGALRELS